MPCQDQEGLEMNEYAIIILTTFSFNGEVTSELEAQWSDPKFKTHAECSSYLDANHADLNYRVENFFGSWKNNPKITLICDEPHIRFDNQLPR
jgi:hypothetical protein